MQIYTGVGDKGQTKIVGNYTVSKDSERVEAYGAMDELNSFVGKAASSEEIWPELEKELYQIQQYLFDCGNDLATSNTEKYPYRVDSEMVQWVEKIIDDYAKEPDPVESFILPGGSSLAADMHICRTVTRRVERRIVRFQEDEESNPYVLQFMNRLSDYFFALARVVNRRAKVEDRLYERSGKVFHLDYKKEEN
ncbi:MAG: cob(I)yrinic acid a,c-diamide adenosyltransferase [Atopostipes suicloacalis]|nr:cob(I)yrinic acid a,c-diamide adenosyltransferase [Atopostipes suicloacalis]MDN6731121.1 cob(I)yrinic acid a,c-diamide adenosyltransferase [Atopostipes suicloacalis]